MAKKKRKLFKKYQYEVRIADLGFSKRLNSMSECMLSYAGTPVNMSPEIMEGKAYSYKTDIWSLGIMLFQMTMGFYPFLGMSKQDLFLNI